MTRLREDWLEALDLKACEAGLLRKTGLDFFGMAATANGITRDMLCEKVGFNIAVIPITAGKGVIGGFAAAVAAILKHAGFRAFVTESADVDGIYEACLKGARVAFMADDRRYIVIDIVNGNVSENSAATARGFVTALDAMSPVSGKKVPILGCGVVGKIAAAELLKKNALPVFYDKNPTAAEEAGKLLGVPYIRDAACISDYKHILDATDEGGWLTNDMLCDGVYISAPGVPLSLTADALALHGERLVYDLLAIGTLAMLGEVLG